MQKDFSPIAAMDAVRAALSPTCAFKCDTPGAVKAWQKRARRELADCVGFLDQKRVPLSPQKQESVDRGSSDEALQTDYFEGRHQISGAKAYDFLKHRLTLA